MFKLQLRTKNFSNKTLKGNIELPLRCVYRAGSLTPTEKCYPLAFGKKQIIEINTVESIENSRSKILMKNCFAKAEVPQSDWGIMDAYAGTNIHFDGQPEFMKEQETSKLDYPVLAKRINGFKGKGMVKIDDQTQLEEFLNNTSEEKLSGYYLEKYHNYSTEYRIHCTQERVFMSWRKLRKDEAENRWFFNSENCNWIGEDNELFDKPSNWDSICEDCVKAIKEVGLDIGSFDVRVQSSKKKDPKYILIEVNSAPAIGPAGIEAYKEELTRIFYNKFNK